MRTEQKSKYYTELIEKNHNQLEPFYAHSFMTFCELNYLKNEILNCLLFEFYQASIFSTNHFLERMVKLTLIKNHTQEFSYAEIQKYREKLDESEKDYDGLTLHNSLAKAYELNLFTDKQFEYIKTAKNRFRNPFSHAQVSKINENATDFGGFMFDFNEVKQNLKQGTELRMPERIEIPKFSPAISQMLQESNSKEIAFKYFKSIFIILREVEDKVFNGK
ncbi:hypothetical protein ACFQ3R_11295 [Mesonia ostreae]|uniref:RiboL-PSP-HEPN domain-containing protein n=1 Tax=Mesonia ostreae TaxID=861110 RepID=A0ABU2KGX6_9FLAO|nr:hypothetical protein [Mesonia ostreae]MDT0293966.1 hypothetical protein [Mesonia ostreae]